MITDNNMADTRQPDAAAAAAGERCPAPDRLGKWLTFISVALAVAAYVILLLWNGMAAAAVSAVALVAGSVALFRASGALRRLAVAAVVAAAVLFVVVMAFVMVISFGLG